MTTTPMLACAAASAFLLAQTASAAIITNQPASASVLAGSPVTFSVGASGSGTLSYQWLRNDAAIPGGTNASYSLAAAAGTNSGAYRVVVSDAGGAASSAVAQLLVAAPWTSPLVMQYDFNAAPVSGTGKVPDTTGNTSGTIYNTPLPLVSSGPTAAGGAWAFTNTTAYIKVADAPALRLIGDVNQTHGLTLAYWIKCGARPGNYKLTAFGGTYFLQVPGHPNGSLQYYFGNDSNIPQFNILSSTSTLDGNWHQVVTTIDFENSSNNVAMYLDAALTGSMSRTIQNSFTSTSGLVIGGSSSGGQPLQAELAQYSLFCQALAPSEIAQYYSTGTITNYAPEVEAVATATQIVWPSATSVTLVGSAVDDARPFPAALTTSWSKVSGPGTISFGNPNALVTTALFGSPGDYVIRFAASDGSLTSARDLPISVDTNTAPAVYVSTPTPSVSTSTTSVSLSGGALDDGLPLVPGTLSYAWTQVSGPGTATFATPSAPSTMATLPNAGVGTYVFQLTANDGALSGSARVSVSAVANFAPVVFASAPQPIFKWNSGGTNTVALTGTVTDDGKPAPSILTYAWTNVSGPGEVSFANKSALNTTASFSQPGVYQVRLAASDGSLSSSYDVWINALGSASGVAGTPPTSVKAFSPNPPPYQHPRIFFTEADRAEMKGRATNDPLVASCISSLQNTVASTLDNPAVPMGKAFAQLKAGNSDYYITDLITDQSPTYDSMKGTYGLYGTLASACYLAWLDQNDPVRLKDLATVVATAARNHATWYVYNSGGSMAGDVYGDLGVCYDLIYNWMTEDQRVTTRALLSRMTVGRHTYGYGGADYDTSTNWRTFHDHLIIAALAIEGETGYAATETADNKSQLKTFVTKWGIVPEGFSREGPGYFGFGMHNGAAAAYALSRRGENLFVTTRLYNSAQEMFYEMLPGNNYLQGHNDAESWGSGAQASSYYDLLKSAFPDDAMYDYVYRNAIQASDLNHQPLLRAMFGRTPLANNINFAVAAAAKAMPLTLYSAQRGLGVSRSGWDTNAVTLDFDCRWDLMNIGHVHNDRNSFYLAALGRQWITDAGYHNTDNDFHSTVLIDGKGSAGSSIAMKWPSPPARFVEQLDNSLFTLFAGDAKFPYTYSWTDSNGYSYNNAAQGMASPFRWADLMPYGYQPPPAIIGGDTWPANYIHVETNLYNPVLKAFRTAVLVRGAKPYVIVLDDIQKDGSSHDYKWSANTIQGGADMTLKTGATATEGILYHAADAKAGLPRLLVRVLEAKGNAYPITLDTTPIEGVSTTRIIIERNNTIAPDFKVLLYPHLDGEALPVTTYSGGVLTVRLPDGTTDTLTLTVQPDGRTRVASFVRGTGAPPTLTLPSLPTMAATTNLLSGLPGAPVTFMVTARDYNNQPLTPVVNPPSGYVFPLGVTPVSVSATDSAGRTTSATFNVSILPPGPTLSLGAVVNLAGTSGSNLVTLSWDSSSGGDSYAIKRANTSGGPYTALATVSGVTSYTDRGLDNTPYYYVITAVSSGLESGPSNEVGTVPPGCPWTQCDVNTGAQIGGSAFQDGTFTLTGGGADLWNFTDNFHFLYQSWTGDGTLIARVVDLSNTQTSAKAGLMFRQNLGTSSTHVLVNLTPTSSKGCEFIRRTSSGGGGSSYGTVGIAPPYWLKLVRSGNNFSAFTSPDGITWASVPVSSPPTVTVTMSDPIYAGLVICSHNTSSLGTAHFDNVSFIGQPAGPSQLTATALSETQIQLSWRDKAIGETAYVVEMSRAGSNSWTVLSETLPPGSTNFIAWALLPKTSYDFRVSAINSTYASAYATVTSTTPAGIGDGIPGSWRLRYFGNGLSLILGVSGLRDDPDGDKMANWQEYIAGTDPTDPTSNLCIASATPEDGGTVISFQTVNGIAYYLQKSTNLASGAWTRVVDAAGGNTQVDGTVLGDGTLKQVNDASGALPSACYYRIQVKP